MASARDVAQPLPASTRALRTQPTAWRRVVDDAIADLRQSTTAAQAADVAARVLPWAAVALRPAVQSNNNNNNNNNSDDDDGAYGVDAVLRRHVTSAVCGRHFGENEFVARCLQCAVDHTCVMCMDCFTHSPCRAHEHRISLTSVGSMCDCGDHNAWLPASFCSRHRGRGVRAPRRARAATTDDDDNNDVAIDDKEVEYDDDDDDDDDDNDAVMAVLSDEEQQWVLTALRGAAQLTAAYLQHSIAMAAAAVRDASGTDNATMTTTTTTTTDADAATTAIGTARRRVAQRRLSRARRGGGTTAAATATTTTANTLLLTPAIAQLLLLLAQALHRVSDMGDCARHVLATVLCERAHIVHDDNNNNDDDDDEEETITCFDVIVRFAMRCGDNNNSNNGGNAVVVRRDRVVAPHDAWPLLMRCVANCITDKHFRAAFAALLAKYAETIHDATELDDLTLQIVGSADAVHAALWPPRMRYRGAHDTTLHRHIAGVLYELCLRRDTHHPVLLRDDNNDDNNNSNDNNNNDNDDDNNDNDASTTTASSARDASTWLFRVDYDAEVNEKALMNWYYMSLCSRRVRRAMALSTSHLRAMLTMLQVVAVSASVRHGADSLDAALLMQLLETACFADAMWNVQSGVRDVIAALLRLRTPSHATTSTRAAVAADTTTTATATATIADENDDEQQQHTQAAAVTRVVRALLRKLLTPRLLTSLEQSCALDTPRDHVAAANDAYARLRRRGDVHDGADALLLRPSACIAAAASAAAAPQMLGAALSFAYVQTLLREVYAALRTLLAVQCRDFCNGDMSLLSSPHNNNDNNNNNGDNSGSARDVVAQYDLLHAKHATTLATNVQRLFALVVRAWLLQTHAHTRNDSNSGNNSGDATTTTSPYTLRALVTSVLCDATTTMRVTTGIPSPSSLSPQQQQQQQQQRLLLHLLDSLVMPFVLVSQVEQRLWRRHGDDVQRFVHAHLHGTTVYGIEHDVFLLQLLTLCMPASCLSRHVLRRFSYAARALPSLSSSSSRQQQQRQQQHATSVVPPSRTRGYARYVRLLLTLVLDTSKASVATADFADASVERMLAHALAQRRLPHSALMQYVMRNLAHSWKSHAADTSHANVKDAVAAALQRIAHGEAGPRGGLLFQLRDTATWSRCVAHVYTPTGSDDALELHYAMYSSLVTRERLAAARASDSNNNNNNNNNNSTTMAAASVVRVPPPNMTACTCGQLPWQEQHDELRPSLRALLHTRALLHVALYALVRYVVEQQLPLSHTATRRGSGDGKEDDDDDDAVTTMTTPAASAQHTQRRQQQRRPRSQSAAHAAVPDDDDDEGDEDDSTSTTVEYDDDDDEDNDDDDDNNNDDDDDDDDDEDNVDEALLQHAVTALYLAVCDDSERHGVAVIADDDDDDDNDDDVLPLGELRTCASLRDMMQHKLRPATLRVATHRAAHNTDSGVAAARDVTVSDVLHALRGHWLRNESEDKYSLTHMLERTLHRLGVARFACADGDDDDDAKGNSSNNNRDAAAAATQSSHAQRLRERQARLLQRMQQRDARALSRVVARADASATTQQQQQHTGSSSSSSAATNATVATANASSSSSDTSSARSVLGRLLLSLATAECCVCRLDRDEPLVLLAHCSASAVLRHLGCVAHTLPEQRTTHAHFTVCGHTAHIACIEKLCTQLAAQWQTRWFQGERYLGPGEYNCPVCLMICTTLAPLPMLATTTTTAATTAAAAATTRATSSSSSADDERSLFADVRESTLTGADVSLAVTPVQHKYASVVASVHMDMANMYVQCVWTSDTEGSSSSSNSNNSSESADATTTTTTTTTTPATTSRPRPRMRVDRAAHVDGAWTLRSVYHVLRTTVEAVAAGHVLARRDVLAITSLLLTSSPRRLALYAQTLRDKFARNGEAFALLLLEVLLCPSAAAALVRVYTCALLRHCDAAQLRRLCATHDGDGDNNNDNDESDVDATWRVCLWAELSCLTLLCVLLTTDASTSLVLAWPASSQHNNSSSSSVTTAADSELPPFVTVCPDALQSASRQRAAVLRMLQFLCQLPRDATTPEAVVSATLAAAHAPSSSYVDNSSDSVATLVRVCHDAATLPLYRTTSTTTTTTTATTTTTQPDVALVYRSPSQWVSCVLERVLHLPATYTALAQAHAAAHACVECAHTAAQLQSVLALLCCTCGGFLCDDCSKAGVLERHAWRCGLGVGVYMDVHRASLIVVSGRSEKLSFLPSVYATEYGETPSAVRSDAWLVRDAARGARLLHLWLLNAWGADSTTIKNTYYGALIA